MVSSEVTRIVFGVVATTEVGGQVAAFDELSRWMLSQCGVELQRRDLRSYQALTESIRGGKSDVAWLPPVVYARLADWVNPLGHFARGAQSTYSSALVSRADAPFRKLADLNEVPQGARAGWVDPWSAAGYVVPRIELARVGIEPNVVFARETFYGSHGDVIAALARGECDVAGTYAQAAADGSVEGPWSTVAGMRVRVLATFPSIPSDVIAARRTLDPSAHARVLTAFRRACGSDEARPFVRSVFGGEDLREGVAPGHAAFRRAFERAQLRGLFD